MPRQYDIDEQGRERDLPDVEPQDPSPRKRTQGPEKDSPPPEED